MNQEPIRYAAHDCKYCFVDGSCNYLTLEVGEAMPVTEDGDCVADPGGNCCFYDDRDFP